MTAGILAARQPRAPRSRRPSSCACSRGTRTSRGLAPARLGAGAEYLGGYQIGYRLQASGEPISAWRWAGLPTGTSSPQRQPYCVTGGPRARSGRGPSCSSRATRPGTVDVRRAERGGPSGCACAGSYRVVARASSSGSPLSFRATPAAALRRRARSARPGRLAPLRARRRTRRPRSALSGARPFCQDRRAYERRARLRELPSGRVAGGLRRAAAKGVEARSGRTFTAAPGLRPWTLDVRSGFRPERAWPAPGARPVTAPRRAARLAAASVPRDGLPPLRLRRTPRLRMCDATVRAAAGAGDRFAFSASCARAPTRCHVPRRHFADSRPLRARRATCRARRLLRVLILLPPSEGKTAPAARRPWSGVAGLRDELTAKREARAGRARAHERGQAARRALKALGLIAGQAGERGR